jgi:hypothetical protein
VKSRYEEQERVLGKLALQSEEHPRLETGKLPCLAPIYLSLDSSSTA